MQTSNTADSPIISSPIVNSPIVNSPIISNEPEINNDFACGCSASIPPGSRVFFMKLCVIVFGVFGGLMYGVYKLMDVMGWFPPQ